MEKRIIHARYLFIYARGLYGWRVPIGVALRALFWIALGYRVGLTMSENLPEGFQIGSVHPDDFKLINKWTLVKTKRRNA